MNAGETDPDDLLPLLLEICEDFLAHASPPTRREVDNVLHMHGITGGPGWLIDMLALTRLRLQNPPSPSNPPPAPNALTSGIAPHHRQSAEETP